MVLLADHEVDLVGRERDTLLGQHEADLLGAGGEAEVMEFDHGSSSQRRFELRRGASVGESRPPKESNFCSSIEQQKGRRLQQACQVNKMAP